MKRIDSRRNAATAIVALALIVASFFPSGAAFAAEDGGYPGAPTRWGVGARPVAMGGAYAAIGDGPTGFWWNPSGIAQVREFQGEAAWRAMSFDRQTGYVAILYPFSREEAAMAFSWTYAGVSDLYEYDTDGVRGDLISNSTNAATFTFGRRFTPALALGATVRYFQQSISNIDAYTVGFDLGFHLRFVRDWDLGGLTLPMSKVRIGGTVQRLGENLPWTTGEYWVKFGESGTSIDERVPVVYRAGIASYLWKDQALVSVDAELSEKQDPRLHVGAEVRPQPLLALRAGLDDTNPTFGAGFDVKMNGKMRFVLDYAFATQPDQIDAEHVFSLGVRF